MAKPLSFKDFTVADYRQDGDEELAYKAQKRKQNIPTGNTGEAVEKEALDLTQRRKRSIAMRKNKAKIKMGRARAERRVANMDKLKKRARRHARNLILQKILKDVPKAELSASRKREIEKRLEKPIFQQKIERLAKKLLPKERKAELERKRGSSDKKDDKGNK